MSVYRRQMGTTYEQLYPQLQKRFDFETDTGQRGDKPGGKLWINLLQPHQETIDHMCTEINQ